MTEIAPLALVDLERAATVLAHAFHDDPVFEWALPNAERSARVLPTFFAAITRLAMYSNETYATLEIDGGRLVSA